MVPAKTPRFLTRTGSVASISSPDAWHQAITTANSVTPAPTKTMNISARSSREPVGAMTRASTNDPITTPHDTAPVRRSGMRMVESAVRRRHDPTTPAPATVLSFDNDGRLQSGASAPPFWCEVVRSLRVSKSLRLGVEPGGRPLPETNGRGRLLYRLALNRIGTDSIA